MKPGNVIWRCVILWHIFYLLLPEKNGLRIAMSVEVTLQVATEAHREQADMDGRTIILHIMTVGAAGKNEFEQMVGPC